MQLLYITSKMRIHDRTVHSIVLSTELYNGSLKFYFCLIAKRHLEQLFCFSPHTHTFLAARRFNGYLEQTVLKELDFIFALSVA